MNVTTGEPSQDTNQGSISCIKLQRKTVKAKKLPDCVATGLSFNVTQIHFCMDVC